MAKASHINLVQIYLGFKSKNTTFRQNISVSPTIIITKRINLAIKNSTY